MGVINSLLCLSSRCCLFNAIFAPSLISYVVVTTPHGGDLPLVYFLESSKSGPWAARSPPPCTKKLPRLFA